MIIQDRDKIYPDALKSIELAPLELTRYFEISFQAKEFVNPKGNISINYLNFSILQSTLKKILIDKSTLRSMYGNVSRNNCSFEC